MYGVDQIVNEFTKVTNNSKTLIDYVITNYKNTVAIVHDSPKISDHSALSINIFNCNAEKREEYFLKNLNEKKNVNYQIKSFIM